MKTDKYVTVNGVQTHLIVYDSTRRFPARYMCLDTTNDNVDEKMKLYSGESNRRRIHKMSIDYRYCVGPEPYYYPHYGEFSEIYERLTKKDRDHMFDNYCEFMRDAALPNDPYNAKQYLKYFS